MRTHLKAADTRDINLTSSALAGYVRDMVNLYDQPGRVDSLDVMSQLYSSYCVNNAKFEFSV